MLLLLGVPFVRGLQPPSEASPEILRKIGEAEIVNRHPIVLIPGFMGIERGTFENYVYWGGTVDLEYELRQAGYTVYTAPVGPISSNWDRACELFASLKGGRVDFGKAHAKTHGHARHGRTFEGLYPEWGTPDPETGAIRKVHLVGHSMGGQTARLLTHLLNQGDAQEIAATEAESLSTLFAGGNDWIASVTTIATPHDGTTLTAKFDKIGELVKMLARWVAVESVTDSDPLLDLQLAHWKPAAAAADMALEDYLKKLIDEDQWREVQDFAYYDLTPEGSREMNQWVQAQSGVYYFSYATSATTYNAKKQKHTPVRGMSLPLTAGARFMGSYTTSQPEHAGGIKIDDAWLENDGMVNTISMSGPKLGSSDTIVAFDGTPMPGVWNFMGVLNPCDHWDIQRTITLLTAAPPGYETLLDFYFELVARLWALEDQT